MHKQKEPTILVIEDNDIFRRLAMDMLSEYTVYSAKTAIDGMKTFSEKKPDITFLDISLPDKSGYEVLTFIEKIDKDAFIIMLTSSNLQKDVKDSLNKGAKGYIIKPFSRQKIKESIEKYNIFVNQS